MPVTARTSAIVAPRKQPRQARAKETVDLLLDATARLLIKDGYDKISTNRIASKAGVSIGSLYQYFPSKEALVAALVDRYIADTSAICEGALERTRGRPIAEAVRATIEALIATNSFNPRLRIVILEQVPRVGRLQKLSEQHTATTALVARVLSERKAELRVTDIELAAFMVVEAANALINASMDPRKPALAEAKIVSEITDFVLAYLQGSR
jgi:AcrR family transcriptional regulator